MSSYSLPDQEFIRVPASIPSAYHSSTSSPSWRTTSALLLVFSRNSFSEIRSPFHGTSSGRSPVPAGKVMGRVEAGTSCAGKKSPWREGSLSAIWARRVGLGISIARVPRYAPAARTTTRTSTVPSTRRSGRRRRGRAGGEAVSDTVELLLGAPGQAPGGAPVTHGGAPDPPPRATLLRHGWTVQRFCDGARGPAGVDGRRRAARYDG